MTKFSSALFITAALLTVSITPSLGQSSQSKGDDFAQGMDDFAPEETEKPLNQLIDSFPAPTGAAEGQAKAADTGPSASAPARQITASEPGPDWQTFEKNGLQVSVPPGWSPLQEKNNAIALAKDFDMKARKGAVVSILFLDGNEYERDFKGGRQTHSSRGGGTITKMDPVDLGGGILFDAFEVGGGGKGGSGAGFMVISPYPNADEDHLSIAIVAMNDDVAPYMNDFKKIRSSVRLLDPASYRNSVIAPADKAQTAGSAPKIGVNGLVSYTVPEGWRKLSDSSDFLSLTTTPAYEGYVTVATYKPANFKRMFAGEFDGNPVSSPSTILGEAALRHDGMTPDAELMDGMAAATGTKAVFVLNRCLPDGDLVAVSLVGLPKLHETNGFDPILSSLTLAMPEGSRPCEMGKAIPATTASSEKTAEQPMSDVWQTYGNSRFGTVTDYPAGYLSMLPPPENGDGRTFESRDGKARVLVFAGHNFDDKTLPELMAAEIANGGYQSLTSSFLQGDRFQIEGTRDGRTITHVEILDQQNAVHTLDIAHDTDLDPGRLADLKEMAITLRVKAIPTGGGQPGSGGDIAQETSNAELEMVFWQSIANSNDPADFEAYLQQWPDGTFSALARNKLSRLAGPAPVPQTSQAPIRSGGVDLARTYTPQRGTKERKAIMDAARIPIGNELGQRVIFVVSVLRTDDNWAFLQATPVQPNGKAINWLKTPYASDWRADVMSDVIMVLLKREGGQWRTMDYVIGPTDVHWYVWLEPYGLPEAFFIP